MDVGAPYMVRHRSRSLVEGLHLLVLVRVEPLGPAPRSLDDVKRHVAVHHPLSFSLSALFVASLSLSLRCQQRSPFGFFP